MEERSMTTVGKIALSEEEQALVDQIEFEALNLADHAAWQSNSQLVLDLTAALLGRSAIPASRLAWFTDPAMNFGRLKGSRKDNFKRHGHTDESMIRHPHFLKFLRYFIFGADLPVDLRDEFARRVAACYGVNGTDANELGDWARGEVRKRKLDGLHSAEEFHKLALDCGVWHSYAEMVYRRVKLAPPVSRYGPTGRWTS